MLSEKSALFRQQGRNQFMSKVLNFLVVGDLFGEPGLKIFEKHVPSLKEKYDINLVIVNGENASDTGVGISCKFADRIEKMADVITLGNHAFGFKDSPLSLYERNSIIRPANYPSECPGKGYGFFHVDDLTIAVLNLQGRVFIGNFCDCPFNTAETLVSFLQEKADIIFIDFHAEVTSEKKAMGMLLDGKVSCMFGTHTHVQTSDEQILPGGSGYITDIGCCCALNSLGGAKVNPFLKTLTVHPSLGEIIIEDSGPMIFNGMVVSVDVQTGAAISIERIAITDNEICKEV
jgi:2',3'-cyclic-nucleotide 2'-phosphodiesterase